MTVTPAPTAQAGTGRATGRLLLWLGVLLGVFAPVVYLVQFQLKHLWVPWYMPIVGTAGLVLVLLSLGRRCTVWRFAALLLIGLLAAGEWLLVSASKLPDYTGPVTAGSPFPAFTAIRTDGTPFTLQQLQGDKNTVLVFFRGRW